MKIKKLGWTDLNLTTIGLGTWAMGGSGWQFCWGPQDDKQSIDTISHALEKGINWIDTAPVYGLGHSEEVIGNALKDIKEKPIIATKCGRDWNKQGKIFGNLKKERIKSEIELSLKRLKIEVIDLYQMHWAEPEEDIEEAWKAVSDAVKQGKIRYAGVCNFEVQHLKRIIPIHPVASLQPPYSMLRREVEKELLGFCAENNIGVVVYSPMQKGLLTGKFSKIRMKNLPEDDHRHNDPRFQEPQLSYNLKLVEELRPIAEKRGRTVAELAIAWCLRLAEVTSAIVGARKPSQIEETANAADWELDKEDIKNIDMILNKYKK